MKIFLFLLLLSSFVFSIHISSAIDLDEIYSGPDGVPQPGWDTPVNPNIYSSYYSVAQFLFTKTTEEAYYYSSVQEVFGPPQVEVESGKDIIDPIVFGVAADGYFFDGLSYWEELPDLNVFFNCKRDGNAILSITIQATLLHNNDDVSQSVNETIKFYFEKECHSLGYREGFSIGMADTRRDDVVKHGIVQKRWMVDSYYYLDKNPIVISPEEHLATFHISMSNDYYGNQYFFEPTILVEDDEMLEVQIRGNAANGGIATEMPTSFYTIFDCVGSGDTEITVSISLGYYGVIQFGFTKECATIDDDEMPGIINIGTTRSDYAGIVADSITSIFWQVGSPKVDIGVEEIKTNFFLSTSSGRIQQILKPVVSVNPPNAFTVTLSGNMRDGGILTGASQHFTVNYICERVSEGTVTISIKMPNAKTVEYSYTKHCKALKRHTEQVWTANQLLITFILCIVAIFVSGYILYKKKKPTNQRKSRV